MNGYRLIVHRDWRLECGTCRGVIAPPLGQRSAVVHVWAMPSPDGRTITAYHDTEACTPPTECTSDAHAVAAGADRCQCGRRTRPDTAPLEPEPHVHAWYRDLSHPDTPYVCVHTGCDAKVTTEELVNGPADCNMSPTCRGSLHLRLCPSPGPRHPSVPSYTGTHPAPGVYTPTQGQTPPAQAQPTHQNSGNLHTQDQPPASGASSHAHPHEGA